MELPVTYIVQFKSIYIVTQLFPILYVTIVPNMQHLLQKDTHYTSSKYIKINNFIHNSNYLFNEIWNLFSFMLYDWA